MKADVNIKHGRETVELKDVEVLEIAPDEVLIELKAPEYAEPMFIYTTMRLFMNLLSSWDMNTQEL